MAVPSAAWRKWRVLAWYWLAQTALLCVVPAVWISHAGSVDGPAGRPWGELAALRVADGLGSAEYWVLVGVLAGGLMLLQAVILFPVRRPRARRERGWPLWLSAAVGGVGALGLLVGVVLAGGSVLRLLEVGLDLEFDDPALATVFRVSGVAALLVGWGVGSVLIYRFMARRLDAGDRHEGALASVSRLLLKGTAVEAIAVIPLDVMIRRKTDCYSGEGTAWTLSVCFSVGLLALGPAIVLPLVARRRREIYAGRCEVCLYDLRDLLRSGRVIDRCPECGAGWKGGDSIPASPGSEPPGAGGA
jgi:hypothetical protein